MKERPPCNQKTDRKLAAPPHTEVGGSSTSSAYPLVLVSVAEVVLSFLVHVVERVSELVIKWSAIMRFECMNDQ